MSLRWLLAFALALVSPSLPSAGLAQTAQWPTSAPASRQASPAQSGGGAAHTTADLESHGRLARLTALLHGATVSCDNPMSSGQGFLVGDARSVLLRAGPFHGGRPFICRPRDAAEPRVRSRAVKTITESGVRFFHLQLDHELPLSPLPISPLTPQLGMVVYVTRSTPGAGPALELVETTVIALTGTTISTAIRDDLSGLTLDAEGRVLGLNVRAERVILAEAALQRAALAPRTSLLPIFGLRMGYEHGGLLGKAFLLSVEGGLAIWDQLALVARVGFGVGSSSDMTRLDGPDGRGVAESHEIEFDAALDVKYRFLLASTASVYLDLAVGLQFSTGGRELSGVALFGQGGCDPATQPCAVVARDASKLGSATNSVAPAFGADLRLGALLLGYRFLPGALSFQQPDAHLITVGLTAY